MRSRFPWSGSFDHIFPQRVGRGFKSPQLHFKPSSERSTFSRTLIFSPTTAAGEAAVELRSALSSFDDGRRSVEVFENRIGATAVSADSAFWR